MPNRLVISSKQRECLLDEARKAHPLECCGLLAGRTDEGGKRLAIERIVPCPNIAAGSQSRFEVDPSARIRLEKELRSQEGPARIIGHYHSHPQGPARPSAADAKRIFEPELVWLIIGRDEAGGWEMAAFLPFPQGGGFSPLAVTEIA